MNDFRTVLIPSVSDHQIDLKHSILTIGSCFSDDIGHQLKTHKIATAVNPFGVMYNPHSIHKALLYSIHNENVPQHTFTRYQEVYLNYDFHSELSSLDQEALPARLRGVIASTHHFLKNASWIIITYGTAWVYERKDTGEIVANCHKQPSSDFNKRLMSTENVINSFQELYHQLKKFNPSVHIILTVSPVRHIKDTLELNSVSKSILRLACHTLSNQFDAVHYFPSYEMMIDDLRDYRFYKRDMIHPSPEAGEYIWEKFLEAYATNDLKKFILSWEEILTALDHKPFHPETAAHRLFLLTTLRKLEDLEGKINVDAEKNLLKNLLTNRK